MTDLQLFTFDIIDKQTPLSQDNFVGWLNIQKSRQDVRFKAINDSLGFIEGVNKVSQNETK